MEALESRGFGRPAESPGRRAHQAEGGGDPVSSAGDHAERRRVRVHQQDGDQDRDTEVRRGSGVQVQQPRDRAGGDNEGGVGRRQASREVRSPTFQLGSQLFGMGGGGGKLPPNCTNRRRKKDSRTCNLYTRASEASEHLKTYMYIFSGLKILVSSAYIYNQRSSLFYLSMAL